MKTTSVAVFALLSASALAQPIVVLKGSTLNTRDIAPSELTDLEARKIHINGHKVGGFFKKAASFGASLLFRRDEDGDLFLVARDLIDDDGELLARDFDDDFLEARDIEDYLETRGFDDYDLEARDFDDEYLEARDFDDEYLEARDLDLEERSLLSSAGRIGSHLFRHADQYHQAASYIPRPQRNNNNNRRQRRDLDEYLEARDLELEDRSLLSSAGRIGSHLFHHAHHVHHAASYIPQGQNNQRRDLIDEDSLYDLD